jgi:hypothetical protein
LDGKIFKGERMSEKVATKEEVGIIEESRKKAKSKEERSGKPRIRSIYIAFWSLPIEREGMWFWPSRNDHVGGSNKMTEILNGMMNGGKFFYFLFFIFLIFFCRGAENRLFALIR